MEIKIYYPNTIQDNDLSAVTEDEQQNTTTEASGVTAPQKLSPVPFPSNKIAKEVVGVAMDTQNRRIKSSFSFSETGSIQIGKYINGESGQIQISPNGIVATNSAGTTTVAIDGTTGDATFAGTITAGAIVAGMITVQGNGGYKINDGTYDIALFGYQLNGF